jgi:hypothetical protein
MIEVMLVFMERAHTTPTKWLLCQETGFPPWKAQANPVKEFLCRTTAAINLLASAPL